MHEKVVIIVIFIEVLKIAENLEKQSFTFFAFLPPYIGV